MMRWIYPIILWLALPLVWLRLQWRGRQDPTYKPRQAERFGAVPEAVQQQPIWFHTVSAGETIAAAPLIAQLSETYPDCPFLVTTMTPTGSQQVLQRLADQVDHCYAPYDFAFAVKKFFRRVQPRLLVLMETELWPNLIAEAHRRDIPVILVNARLSARSARGYARVASLTRRMLQQVSGIACQNAAHQKRFIDLGAPPQRVSVLGSVKFDVALPPDVERQSATLAQSLGLAGQAVWIAASTHPGEEQIVLKSFTRLRQQHPQLRLLLVPRHPNRADEVEQLIVAQGYSVQRQSCAQDQPVDVILGDVMGTLLQLYGVAQVAFVGGSLVEVGGHNPIEPALHGLPIFSGPQQFNFVEPFAQLIDVGAVTTVYDAADLADGVSRLLQDTDERLRIGAQARAMVASNRGASARVMDMLGQQINAVLD
ncbi:MAG: lipid IV(A) 3-deoxy-D-manno-octulosonic acid transferase [Pseudomonadota bacterium]